MIVYHICEIATPSNGIYTVLNRLSEEQTKLGNDIRIFNFYNSQLEDKRFETATLSFIKTEIEFKRPDVIIFHGIFYKAVIDLFPYLCKTKIPYLIELHGALSFRNSNKSRLKKWIARKIFLDKIIKHAEAIIYLNQEEYGSSSILDVNPRGLIIPNGCDIEPHVIVEKCNEKVEFLFLGRIDIIHKGLDILLDAICYLKVNYDCSKFHFSFYGNGKSEDENYLKSRVRDLGLLADYYGPVYGEDKQMVFAKSDIFLLTSRYEGFPMAILEALSNDLPCLVTPMTNTMSMIEKYGCGWISMLDPRDIAKNLLISSKSFMGKRKNCSRAIENLGWTEIAKKSIEEYSRILSSNELTK